MTRQIAADRRAPLTDDLLLEERVAFLLRRANIRQFWMMFLTGDDVQTDVIMPCADLPLSPDERTEADDAGAVAAGELLGIRVAQLMHEFGFAQAVFVWERPGGRTVGDEERAWARALAESCRDHGARVRAQFLLHDRGVRIIAPDDYA